VVIAYSSDVPAGPPGHLIFVSASEQKRVSSVLGAFNGTPALTVSDIDQFADHGGVIGLVGDGPSVRFVINRAAATRARLQVSSKLLSLATILDRDSIGSTAHPTGSLADATPRLRFGGAGLH
jgi:hypothetical protein